METFDRPTIQIGAERILRRYGSIADIRRQIIFLGQLIPSEAHINSIEVLIEANGDRQAVFTIEYFGDKQPFDVHVSGESVEVDASLFGLTPEEASLRWASLESKQRQKLVQTAATGYKHEDSPRYLGNICYGLTYEEMLGEMTHGRYPGLRGRIHQLLASVPR